MRQRTLDILLVEDNPGDVRLIQMHLAESDLPVGRLTIVERLDEAVSHQLDHPDQLVLLDLNLPDSQGLETLYAFIDRFPGIAVVVLTGIRAQEMGLDAVRTGAQDFLEKHDLSPTLLERSIHYALERHRLMQVQREMALRDPLTGLYNRRGFRVLAAQQVRLARRRGGGLTMVFLDVDGLKAINDQFGHRAGDQLLKDVARVLQLTFRDSDVLSRIGGDEFAALAADTESGDGQAILERLNEQMASCQPEGRPYSLSVSAGVAFAEEVDELTVETLLRQADEAMYSGKREKGRVASE